MRSDLILFGPPGAGKGTQGALLAHRFGLLRLSTGDVLRDAVQGGTPMGMEAQRFMNAGELVPDTVILGIVRDHLLGPASGRGVVFDGFPRTLPQAQSLDALLAELGRRLRAVLVLEVDDETLVKRLSGRRSCPACGAVYNVYFEPPQQDGRCDACGAVLTQRPDDAADTVRRRLEVYHEQTAPLLAYYDSGRAVVRRVNGDRSVEDVHSDLARLMEP